MGKIEAAIPDSDLDLHVHGCWAMYEGVAVRITETDNNGRCVRCVCEAEGVDEWVPIDKVKFVWPDMGYVNTSPGAVWCVRHASAGRHYRRAFGSYSFRIYNLVCDNYAPTSGSERDVGAITHQLFNPSYPTLREGYNMLRGMMRPSVAISSDVALSLGCSGDVLVHVCGRAVGSLDYADGEPVVSWNNTDANKFCIDILGGVL